MHGSSTHLLLELMQERPDSSLIVFPHNDWLMSTSQTIGMKYSSSPYNDWLMIGVPNRYEIVFPYNDWLMSTSLTIGMTNQLTQWRKISIHYIQIDKLLA